jgi:hypothetical protein
MPELQAFLPHWRWAVIHLSGAVARPKRWLAHRTPLLSSSLFLSISLGLSFFLSRFLSNLSLSVGTKRKEEQERRKKEQGRKEEKRKKKKKKKKLKKF